MAPVRPPRQLLWGKLSALAGTAVLVLTRPSVATESTVSGAVNLESFIPVLRLCRAIEVACTGLGLNDVAKVDMRRAKHLANPVNYAMLAI